MNKFNWKVALGIGLLLLGALTLTINLELLPVGERIWEVLIAGVFAVAGLVFIGLLASDRDAWWAAFPGFSLLGVGAVIALGSLAPRLSGVIGGAVMLGSISLAFWLVFLLRREFWWALIPAGVLMTLAGITLVPSLDGDGNLTAGLFFLGLAATFLLLLVLPPAEDRQGWAWIPAAVLAVMGLGMFFFTSARYMNLVLPAALILGGIYLVYRSLQK